MGGWAGARSGPFLWLRSASGPFPTSSGPFLGPRASSRLLGLFPAFSGPRGPLLDLFLGLLSCFGPLPSLFWASGPVLGLF